MRYIKIDNDKMDEAFELIERTCRRLVVEYEELSNERLQERIMEELFLLRNFQRQIEEKL